MVAKCTSTWIKIAGLLIHNDTFQKMGETFFAQIRTVNMKSQDLLLCEFLRQRKTLFTPVFCLFTPIRFAGLCILLLSEHFEGYKGFVCFCGHSAKLHKLFVRLWWFSIVRPMVFMCSSVSQSWCSVESGYLVIFLHIVLPLDPNPWMFWTILTILCWPCSFASKRVNFCLCFLETWLYNFCSWKTELFPWMFWWHLLHK